MSKTRKLTDAVPAGKGKNREKKSSLRPLTDKQRRAAKREQDAEAVAFRSENEQFSISGNKAVGLPEYKNHKTSVNEHIVKLKAEIPAPRIVDLEISNPVLAQVEDIQLRTRLQNFFQILLEGGKHKIALEGNDFTWNHIQNLRHKYTGLHELWIQCRDIGDEYRQVLRADAAHERAVEGVEEAVFSPSGKCLGSRRVYSDRLLELLLKADNPEKFSDHKKVDIRGTVINLTPGFDRRALREEVAQEAIDVDAVERNEDGM